MTTVCVVRAVGQNANGEAITARRADPVLSAVQHRHRAHTFQGGAKVFALDRISLRRRSLMPRVSALLASRARGTALARVTGMPSIPARARRRVVLLFLACCAWAGTSASAESRDVRQITLSSGPASIHFLAGHQAFVCQATVILASGDLGWAGFVTDLADRLSVQGCDVAGFDTRAYLTAATRRAGALDPSGVPGDILTLVDAAEQWRPRRHVFLVGIAEGAGLSILAAADARVGQRLSGVIGLGTPETVTLGWHFWNWTTWVTHREVDEPSVHTAAYLALIRSLPVAFLHATGDEFVPLSAIRVLYALAEQPKRLDIVPARNHRFSDTRAAVSDKVMECLEWARALRPSATSSASRLDVK